MLSNFYWRDRLQQYAKLVVEVILLNSEYWKAIKHCDSAYDGLFYYAVKTTGIFCRPSCKSKLPNQQNIDIFLNKIEPIECGYRPCKRCRPDETEYLSSKEELFIQACRYIEDHYKEDVTLEKISNELFVNKFYLLKVFSKQAKMSPSHYLRCKRIQEAKRLITSTDHSFTAIAFEVGFKNPSHFSTVFSKLMGITPKRYREASPDFTTEITS
ncbi:bifunctional transcriptional activator/DNA repair enzyme AdaA [Jeotgalibacillus proteolyticus]|uniref:AraC family transcriptional regulator n=1 Tax=Jeotgalibacillus proteolyticus TaxID=2082395 RepID=A0A2S5G9L8_9BACL|nr:Ada metal-binding domain-containing protein [Jeotgalibacillus proteolyticus]PPA69613.1 AraC family transcriptional regulator [Jeotgalibacillus proteolyticus]